MVEEFFDGKELKKDMNPEKVVAYGASIEGRILCDDSMGSLTIMPDGYYE